MERIADLIQEKNRCLVKFRSVTEREINKFESGDFENIERFYKDRESLLEMIQKIDLMIGCLPGLDDDLSRLNAADRDFVTQALAETDQLVKEIVEKDLKVLALVDQEKSEIIRNLSQIRAVRRAFGGYKGGKAFR